MNRPYTNPCIRCGQERVVSKTWKETITTFSGTLQEVMHIEAVCPDPECQEALDKEFAKQKEKRDKIASDREQRMKDNQAKKGGLRAAIQAENAKSHI